MEKGITEVGLDAHKVSTNVAVLLGGAARPVEWQVSTERGSIRKMVKKVVALAPGVGVRFCYEAGPCGYEAGPQRGPTYRMAALRQLQRLVRPHTLFQSQA